MDFDKIVDFVKKSETVYKKGHYGDDNFVVVERDPDDPGGTTKWGLDARTHGEIVAKLSWNEAKKVYFDWYWKGNAEKKWESCENFSPIVAAVLFDSRINCGFSPASKFLQEQTPEKMIQARGRRYLFLVSKNQRLKKYINGWLNRNKNLSDFLGLKYIQPI